MKLLLRLISTNSLPGIFQVSYFSVFVIWFLHLLSVHYFHPLDIILRVMSSFASDKSSLKSKDLEWFFFCPREKKYASGSRVKRATENGYWKTTGKDRIIHYNKQTVGTVKTLVFHLGHAPQGERTDWVLYEYRIVDEKLAAAGLQVFPILAISDSTTKIIPFIAFFSRMLFCTTKFVFLLFPDSQVNCFAILVSFIAFQLS